MSVHTYLRSPWSLVKRLRVVPPQFQHARANFSTSRVTRAEATENDEEPAQSFPEDYRLQDAIEHDLIEWADERKIPLPNGLRSHRRDLDGNVIDPNDTTKSTPTHADPRLPRSVQALYIQPLKRQAAHGLPVCDLQLRSYSVRNLEFMADFALRAAYYLNLPAKGPVPLPRITERWTVPRSNFIFKKSQENWERITMRRLIQIQDGHPDVVRRWLGFVRKWCYYGVGMKANVWEWESLDVVKNMDANEEAVEEGMKSINWDLLLRKKGLETPEEVAKLLEMEGMVSQKAALTPTKGKGKAKAKTT